MNTTVSTIDEFAAGILALGRPAVFPSFAEMRWRHGITNPKSLRVANIVEPYWDRGAFRCVLESAKSIHDGREELYWTNAHAIPFRQEGELFSLEKGARIRIVGVEVSARVAIDGEFSPILGAERSRYRNAAFRESNGIAEQSHDPSTRASSSDNNSSAKNG